MLTNRDISKLEEKFVTKEEFLRGFDAVMYELRSLREKITVMFYRQSENTNNIQINSKKIEALEDKLSF